MREIIVVCLALLLASSARPQSVVTELIPPSATAMPPLDGAFGVAVSPNGDAFVAGDWSNNVLRFSPGGVVTQVVGPADGLLRPQQLATDRLGNLYVAGADSDNVLRVSPAGAVSVVISDSMAGVNLQGPNNVAVSDSLNVYVGGGGSDNVYRISPTGVITEILNSSNAVGGFCLPLGITVDAAENVYVVGSLSDNVHKIDPFGNISVVIDVSGDGTNGLIEPAQVEVGRDGAVYVSGFSSCNAFRIDPSGAIEQIIDMSGDQQSMLLSPGGIAVDDANNVYVAGVDSDNVFKITPAGDIQEIMSASSFVNQPGDVAVGGDQTIYVSGFITDNLVSVLTPPTSPGTDEGLVTSYSINGSRFARATCFVADRVSLFNNDFVTVCHESLDGTFVGGGPVTVFGSVVSTSAPAPSPFPGLYLDLFTAFGVIGGGVGGYPIQLPPTGLCYSFRYVAGTSGLSLILQCTVQNSTVAGNGIFASTDALRFDLM